MRRCAEKDGGPPGVPASGRWRRNVKRVWQRTFGAAAEFPGGLRSEPMFMAVGGAVGSSGVFKHQCISSFCGVPFGFGGGSMGETYQVVKTFFVGCWM